MEPVVELISPVYWKIEVCGDSPHWIWGGHHNCLRVWVEVGVLRGTAFWSGCSASCKFYAYKLADHHPLSDKPNSIQPYSIICPVSTPLVSVFIHTLPTLCLCIFCQLVSPPCPWSFQWPFVSSSFCMLWDKYCSMYNSCSYPCILYCQVFLASKFW